MAACEYMIAVTILFGTICGGIMDMESPRDQSLLIATHPALVDLDRLSITLATHETPQVEQLIDASALRGQIAARLKEAGLKSVAGEAAGTCPRLVIQIEGVTVPDCEKYVCRVQTSVNRVVTYSDHRDLRIEAEVWRLRPVMSVMAATEAPKAIANTILVQVEAFVGAYEATRKLHSGSAPVERNVPDPNGSARTKLTPQNLQAVAQYPYVASKSSPVFHRADCRWAQNISDRNRVGYATREEAVQAGKRPCKLCRP
jgi:hypothetical protein